MVRWAERQTVYLMCQQMREAFYRFRWGNENARMDAGAGDGGRGGSESKKLFANRSHVFPIEIDTLLGRFI